MKYGWLIALVGISMMSVATPTPAQDGQALLLVHGLWGGPDSWADYSAHLRGSGWSEGCVIEFPSGSTEPRMVPLDRYSNAVTGSAAWVPESICNSAPKNARIFFRVVFKNNDGQSFETQGNQVAAAVAKATETLTTARAGSSRKPAALLLACHEEGARTDPTTSVARNTTAANEPLRTAGVPAQKPAPTGAGAPPRAAMTIQGVSIKTAALTAPRTSARLRRRMISRRRMRPGQSFRAAAAPSQGVRTSEEFLPGQAITTSKRRRGLT